METALKTKPDLILLDLLLPRMSGEDLLIKLRQDPWGKNVKVIVITNVEDKDLQERIEKIGVSDYIIKSDTTMKNLMEIIFKVLNPVSSH